MIAYNLFWNTISDTVAIDHLLLIDTYPDGRVSFILAFLAFKYQTQQKSYMEE